MIRFMRRVYGVTLDRRKITLDFAGLLESRTQELYHRMTYPYRALSILRVDLHLLLSRLSTGEKLPGNVGIFYSIKDDTVTITVN